MNDKKINQMSGNISELLAERLGQQVSTALVEALYPEISRLGQTMEQMAQNIKFQSESGIHTLADSFFARLTRQTTDYNADIIENILNANKLQLVGLEQSEKLIERLEEKNTLLMERMIQEREELQQYIKQSSELLFVQTDAIQRLQGNQELLSSRLEQMEEQYRITDGQLNQAILMTEKLNQGQERLNQHTEELLGLFGDCQRQWIEDVQACNSSLEQQSQAIRSSLETTSGQIHHNLEAASENIRSNLETSSQALLETSTKAKSCIELLDRSFTDYQQKLEENLSDVFGVMDRQLAEISKSLGQGAEEIAAASKAVPRAMRSVIEEMRQAVEG